MYYFLGLAVTLLAIVAIVAGYLEHMAEIFGDIANEKAERMAEKRFAEMLDNAEIRVVQRLYVVDEMENNHVQKG